MTTIGGSAAAKPIVDGALTALTFVGFGITGPWGLALAGAASVAETLFNDFFNATVQSFSHEVGDIVQRLLGKKEITDRANVVQTSLKTWEDNRNEMRTMDTRQLATLLDVAVHQVQDTSDLNQAINFLKGNISVNFMDTEEMKRSVVALYGLAISVKLLWAKVAAMLDDSKEMQGDMSKSGYVHTIISVGDEALGHIDAMINAIEGEIVARGAKVQPCADGSFTFTAIMSPMSSISDYVAFNDSANPWNQRDEPPEEMRSELLDRLLHQDSQLLRQARWDACTAKRATYLANIQDDVRKRYSYNRDDLATMRRQLAETINKFR